MSPTFVDNDGQLNWRKIGYHARSGFAVVLALAVLIGGGWFVVNKVEEAWVAWRTQDDYIGEGKDEVVVVIPAGAGVTTIGDILTEYGVIKSTRTFRNAVAQVPGADKKLQAGRYRLRTELPAATAVEMMLDPAYKEPLRITVREGLAKTQIWTFMQEQLGFTPEALDEASASSDLALPGWANDNIEGFLFPDTYDVAEPPVPLAVLQQQVDQFNKVAGSLNLESRAAELGFTPYQVLIVASIIEKEAARDEDRPKIAGVIYNRLEADKELQFDSTVHYAVNDFSRVTLTDEDLATESPYNTYKHKGLPPGPISNPGRAAIEAALNPENHEYLYFVAVNLDTGETLYATDEAGHAANVQVWQAWCAANPGRCN